MVILALIALRACSHMIVREYDCMYAGTTWNASGEKFSRLSVLQVGSL